MAPKKEKLLESAQRFLLKGQLDKAIKDYQQVVALEPHEIRFRQKLAELLVRDNRKDEAIVQYEDIGKHYTDNSYFLKAIAVYKQIQRLAPDDNAVGLTLASLNHKQGLIGNALAEYGQVVARLENEGALKEALKVLDEMLAIDDSGQAAPRLKQAEILFRTGAEDASYQAFSALLTSLRSGGDVATLQKVSERMSHYFPDQRQCDLDLISSQVSSGDFEGASALLQERLKRDSSNLEAWQLLYDAESRRGNRSGARLVSKQMVDRFAEEPGVLEATIRCEIEENNFSAALALLELHLPRFIEKGVYLSAERLLLSIPADGANLSRINDGLSRIYEASGEQDKLDALQSAGTESSQQLPLQAGQSVLLAAEVAAPSAFDAAPGEVEQAPAETEPASAFGSPWEPEAQNAAGTGPQPETAGFDSPPAEFDSPWEEEIELDLGDDPADHEVDISLDFSLSLDLGEPADAADLYSDAKDILSGAPESSPFGELSFAEESSPFAEESSPFAEESPFADASAEEEPPFGDPYAAGEEEAEEALTLELEHEVPLELTLHNEPEIGWGEEIEDIEPSEIGDVPELSGSPDLPPFLELSDAPEAPECHEPPEQHAQGELAADCAPASEARQLRDWHDIYPDSADQELDVEELESHYDLGIGYKEMGLYNAAIKEFSIAAGNPQRRLACLTLQAMCYREKGEPEKAEELLQRGRDLDVLSVQERMSLSYELAFLFETTGAADEAIALYREVLEVDPNFHDVAQRLFALAGDEPLDEIELELEEADL